MAKKEVKVYQSVAESGGDITIYYSKSSTLYVRCVRELNGELEWSKTPDKKMTWNEAIEYAKTVRY